ncbi:hypothetical protein APHAL10511_006216 [Amanita phalloides]|nr:hypothetical protein APHAL10511_006216 [Amanita phalloides]
MCGILVLAHADINRSPLSSCLWQKLRVENASRGPDAQNECQFYTPGPLEYRQFSTFLFVASELRLRGEGLVRQPHLNDGNILCWNGEIFEGMEISVKENDGVKLMDALCSLENPDCIPELLGQIEGPYAFVFYHKASQKLFFARDPLGRRSLLIHRPKFSLPFFLLASVSAGADCSHALEELDTDHVYGLDTVVFQERGLAGGNIEGNFNHALKRWRRHPSDISNLPFAAPRKVNTDSPSVDQLERPLDEIRDFLAKNVDDLIYQLDRSVELQLNNIPTVHQSMTRARVAILFSGGIDSAVIAYFAHKHVPPHEPIDLLNVAFDNPWKKRVRLEATLCAADVSYLVPDRVTGLQELEELRRVCPGRQWNFVEINIPYQESQTARPLIESIMYPSHTVMDLSLALALYFASRGIGQVRDASASDPKPYTSLARVLLNGLGADELLGGYSRHRTAYGTGGWQAVIDELQLDLNRIPTRNLGRDDRIISSHGKETRHPFLSLSVVNFLAGLPVHHKMDPRLELGIGDKMLLRLASEKIGLVEASRRKKRAMQFGSRSARMEGQRRGDVTLHSTDSYLARLIVPLGVGVALVQASIYDVPGGHRAVMFDRFSGVKNKATGEGTHLLVPWLQRAILYDCRIKPRNISTTTGSKDLQMVSITLRVLSRPDVEHLSRIYQSLGMDYDERVLPSIGNEVLKSIVAQFDAAELITQREVVSSRIRADLLQRAGEFHIVLEDVSITHLTFGKEFTQAVEAKQIAQQDAERAKFIVDKAEQERQAAVIRAEGEAEAAGTISRALEKAGEAFVALRKIEASKAIVQSLAQNGNVTWVPTSASGVLLSVPAK